MLHLHQLDEGHGFELLVTTSFNHIFAKMADASESGNSTPNTSRWTSQAHAVEDRLKEETIGLVTLDDFRKRRAEALEAAQDVGGSGATTPDGR